MKVTEYGNQEHTSANHTTFTTAPSKRRFVCRKAGRTATAPATRTSGSASSLGGTDAPKLGLHSANGNLVISQGQIDAADECIS